MRYLGTQAALIVNARGRRSVVQSIVPLRGRTGHGALRPIDLSLQKRGDYYAPASTAAPIRIPAIAAGDVTLSAAHVGVRALAARSTTAVSINGKAFYANAFPDTDLVWEPAPAGAELSAVLRSPGSPRTLTLAFDLQPDERLTRATSIDRVPAGAIVVRRQGRDVAWITPAAAEDAQRQPLAVRYSILGRDRLAMHVHVGGDVAWPVRVDPTVGETDYYGQNTNSTGCGFPNWQFYTNGGSFNGQWMSCGLFNYGQIGYAYSNQIGEWISYARSGAYIYRFDVGALTHTADDSNMFAGIYCQPCAGWEPGAGWSTTYGTLTSGHAYYQDGNNIQNTGDIFTARSGAPDAAWPSNDTGNIAAVGMSINGKPTGARPTVSFGVANLYESDNIPPWFDSMRVFGRLSGWVGA